MDVIKTILISLVSSGILTVLIAPILNKINEKESRIYKIKLDTYTEFTKHLLSFYNPTPKKREYFDQILFDMLSSKIILIAPNDIKNDILNFNTKLYKAVRSPDVEREKELDSLIDDRKLLLEKLREDLYKTDHCWLYRKIFNKKTF